MKLIYSISDVAKICEKVVEDLRRDGTSEKQLEIIELSFLNLRAELLLLKEDPLPSMRGTFQTDQSPFLSRFGGSLPGPILQIIETDFAESEKKLFSSISNCPHGFADPSLCLTCHPEDW